MLMSDHHGDLLMTCLRPLAHSIYRLIFPAKTVGLDNYRRLPADQPLIVVANHPGYHDPILLISRIDRNLHFLAKAELLDGHFGWFFNRLGLVRVDRDKHGSGLEQAKRYLMDDHIIALFPEGTIKFKTVNQLLPFKHGAVKLANATGAPILPVAIIGRPRPFWFRRCKICFGQAYHPNEQLDIDQETTRLQEKILELMKANGVGNAEIIPGKPAQNPGKEPPKQV